MGNTERKGADTEGGDRERERGMQRGRGKMQRGNTERMGDTEMEKIDPAKEGQIQNDKGGNGYKEEEGEDIVKEAIEKEGELKIYIERGKYSERVRKRREIQIVGDTDRCGVI